MRKLLLPFSLLCILAAPVVHALSFGEPFSVTNTRYGTVPGESRLIATGSELFLFWSSNGTVRVTRLAEGVKRVGRPVLAASDSSIDGFDVVWTGEHFFVASVAQGIIRGRLLDRSGEPLGGEIELATHAYSPRLAFNGSTILLIFRGLHAGVTAQPLTARGIPNGAPEQLDPFGASHAVASNGRGFVAVISSYDFVAVTAFDANGRRSTQTLLSSERGTRWPAIASDGTNYLASVLVDTGAGFTTVVNGTTGLPGHRASLPNPARGRYGAPPSSAWSGSDYVVAYVERSLQGTLLSVLRHDAQGNLTGSEPPVPANLRRVGTSLAAANGRALIAWNPREESVVEEIPASGSAGAWSTFGAAPQNLLASASANGAVLMVWSDAASGEELTRVGVRKADGDWIERILLDRGATRAAAASNGTDFLVAIPASGGTSIVYRVDTRAIVSSKTTTVPFLVTGIARSGQTFGLIGTRSNAEGRSEVVGALLSSAGTLSATTLIRSVGDVAPMEPAIASDGERFLVVWRALENFFCPFPCIAGIGVGGARLGPDLARLDATDLQIAPFDSVTTPPAVSWNGRDYLVAWENYDSVWMTQVRPNGALSLSQLSTTPARVIWPGIVTLSDGKSIVTWQDTGQSLFGAASYPPQQVFVVVGADGVVSASRRTLPGATADSQLAALTGERFAFLSGTVWNDAPHHGSMRVSMRTGDTFSSGSVQPPLAPSDVRARADSGRVLVEWNAATGGPITGYRIEYRVGDGSWNEVGAWYDATKRSESLVMPDNTAFRVRAFSDWGVSAPSLPTPPVRQSPPRRRAVR